jgi:hypothetical protein
MHPNTPSPSFAASGARAYRRFPAVTLESPRMAWRPRRAPPVSVVAPSPWRRERWGLRMALVALLGVAAVGGWCWHRRPCELRVVVAAAQGRVDRAEVFVDGEKRCDVSPCVAHDLASGRHRVVVLAPGRRPTAPIAVDVEPGHEHVAFVLLFASNEPGDGARGF